MSNIDQIVFLYAKIIPANESRLDEFIKIFHDNFNQEVADKLRCNTLGSNSLDILSIPTIFTF